MTGKRKPRWAAVRTLGCALLLLLLASSLLEVLARTPGARRLLPAPHRGINYWFLDLKLDLLQRFGERGAIDCIFTGHSTVDAAIDPEVFGRHYRRVTGRTLRSFNLGIARLDLPSLLILLRIIADPIRPRLVVAGIMADDLLEGRRSAEASLAHAPWIRQRLGDANLEGWLIDHSIAYRYFLRGRLWLEYPSFSRSIRARERETAANGYRNYWNDVSLSRGKRKAPKVSRSAGAARKLRLSAHRLETLDKIIGFCARRRIGLVWVEMPLASPLDGGTDGERAARRRLLDSAAEHIRRRGSFFLSAEGVDVGADAFWCQRTHMNSAGAERFSSWLGREIGRAVRQGLVRDPAAAAPAS
ncbi:MAG: hypothetical protein JXO51_10875 [Candidatus Aminicenantes bacterium]|nr:hypothetical protein [Candidatus Aminicenantes bacterium]